MKNILRIFKYDLKKIHKNVIAMIVIMGITVIPTLYAWFNIAASWDPYGNTGNLKVAVASSDEGYSGELLSVNLNLGDQILTTLRGNSQLDWTFTSAKKAKEGVKSGKPDFILPLYKPTVGLIKGGYYENQYPETIPEGLYPRGNRADYLSVWQCDPAVRPAALLASGDGLLIPFRGGDGLLDDSDDRAFPDRRHPGRPGQ